MAKNSATKIREAILYRRQIDESKRVIEYDLDSPKTLKMQLIEQRYKKGIDCLVWEGSITDVSKKLKITPSTVTLWRRKFPLNEYRIGKNNRKFPVSESGRNGK